MTGPGAASPLALKQQKYPEAQQMFYSVLIPRAGEMIRRSADGLRDSAPVQKCEDS